ncbi:MAG: hypothetical protein EOP07_22160, partial [Proteobacteria bacterium]
MPADEKPGVPGHPLNRGCAVPRLSHSRETRNRRGPTTKPSQVCDRRIRRAAEESYTLSELLKNLNDVQRQAVLHRNGPLVVFAGAGSGKTRIITTRIAYLIETGVLPWEILAVTFTNKAAEEMRHRSIALAPETRRSTITTFHSASARWLREFAGELGYEPNFSIYDDQDVTRALKHILKQVIAKGDIP